MGTVVQFPPKSDVEMESAELILAQVAEVYRRRTKAREELPALLADLVEAGETELALQALRLWGHGQMEPDEVMAFCHQALGR